MASASRARWVMVAAAMLWAGAAAHADRVAYQGQFGPTGRGILISTETGAKAEVLPAPPGAQGDLLTPALSRDGRMVAFSARKGENFHIFVWELGPDNKPTGNARQLTDAAANDEQPVWSPDGSLLAFVRASEKEGYGLYTVPTAGGEPTRLAGLTHNFRNACPDWSPNGTRLVYNVDDALWVMAADGSGAQKVRDDGYYPCWGKDSKTIYFFAKKPKPALMAMDADSRKTRVLLTGVEGFGEVTTSPSGDRILFKAAKVGGKPGNHWIVQADGSRLRPLKSAGTAHAYLSWSFSPQAASPPVVVAKPEGPVSIISPQNGVQGLRGFVEVVATKQRSEGYVSFSVDGVFQTATVAPYKFRWDTRSVMDGEHVLAATAFDMDALQEGVSTVRVSVRNAIDPSTLGPEGISLALRFKPGETLAYRMEAEGKAGAPGEVLTAENGRLNGLMKTIFEWKVERAAGDGGVAELTGTTRSISLTRATGEERVPESARAMRLQANAEGLVQAINVREGTSRFGVFELCTGLPGRKVRVGDTWQAPMTIIADLASRQPVTVTGNHVLQSLQWDGDMETAKIVSTYSIPRLAVPGTGIVLNNVNGQRATWVGYKTFRVVRMEDTIKGQLSQQPATVTAATPGTTTTVTSAAPAPPSLRGLRLGGRGSNDEGASRTTTPRPAATPASAPGSTPPPAQPPTPTVQYVFTLKMETAR